MNKVEVNMLREGGDKQNEIDINQKEGSEKIEKTTAKIKKEFFTLANAGDISINRISEEDLNNRYGAIKDEIPGQSYDSLKDFLQGVAQEIQNKIKTNAGIDKDLRKERGNLTINFDQQKQIYMLESYSTKTPFFFVEGGMVVGDSEGYQFKLEDSSLDKDKIIPKNRSKFEDVIKLANLVNKAVRWTQTHGVKKIQTLGLKVGGKINKKTMKKEVPQKLDKMGIKRKMVGEFIPVTFIQLKDTNFENLKTKPQDFKKYMNYRLVQEEMTDEKPENDLEAIQ